MTGRKYAAPNSTYRYGFNGKENDNEVKGEGNQQDYGMRIYDPRLGRFLSVDPLTKQYAWYTPYSFAGNKPIWAIDLDGLEEVLSTAAVKYRVNSTGAKLHGYYNKGYSMSIYSVGAPILAVGYRADSDNNSDWAHASVHGTTQAGNKIEAKYGTIGFDPSKINMLTIPGSSKGQSHFDGLQKANVSMGDLYFAQVINKEGSVGKSIVGILGDVGPNSQPGEQSDAANNALIGKGETSGSSNVIYIVFPNSSKYLEDVIGKDENGKLLRAPTNEDIQVAYNTYRKQNMANENGSGTETQKANTISFWKLFNFLKKEKTKEYFDEANPSTNEKRKAKAEAPNNNRNANN